MPRAFTTLDRQTVVELDTRVLDALIAQTPARADQIVRETAEQVQAVAQSSMVAEGSGRVYIKNGIPHRASAPGEPPAVDTGNLRANIYVRKESPLVYRVDVDAEYGLYLEFGTSRMSARPFLFPAVMSVEKQLYARWLRLLK